VASTRKKLRRMVSSEPKPQRWDIRFDDPSIAAVRPTMVDFFYMDEKDPTKVKRWVGAVGPTGF
jgi:hypothetical protein